MARRYRRTWPGYLLQGGKYNICEVKLFFADVKVENRLVNSDRPQWDGARLTQTGIWLWLCSTRDSKTLVLQVLPGCKNTGVN